MGKGLFVLTCCTVTECVKKVLTGTGSRRCKSNQSTASSSCSRSTIERTEHRISTHQLSLYFSPSSIHTTEIFPAKQIALVLCCYISEQHMLPTKTWTRTIKRRNCKSHFGSSRSDQPCDGNCSSATIASASASSTASMSVDDAKRTCCLHASAMLVT